MGCDRSATRNAVWFGILDKICIRLRAARLRRDESSRALRGSGGTSPPVRYAALAGRIRLKVKVRSGECRIVVGRIIKALEEVAGSG